MKTGIDYLDRMLFSSTSMCSSPETVCADAKTFNSRNHITIFSPRLRRERCSERLYRSEANVFEPLECTATFSVSNANKWLFEKWRKNNVSLKVILK